MQAAREAPSRIAALSSRAPVPLLLSVLLCAPLAWSRPKDPASALARARTAWEAGKPDKALKRLGPLEGGDLADHVALIRARWLHESGSLDEALAATRTALTHDPPTELRARIHHEAAAIQRTRGDLLAAYRQQRRAWETTHAKGRAAEWMHELAVIFETSQLPGDALRLHRKLWQTWPLAPQAVKAYARSQFLAQATGATPVTPERDLERAERLRRAHRCKDGIEIYTSLASRPDLDPKLEQTRGRGHAACLFQLRRYEEATRAYRALLKPDPKAARLQIALARSQGRAGQPAPAIQTLLALAKSTDRATQAEARYLIAILLPEDERQRSRKLLRAVQGQGANGQLARQARWRLAWAELGEGHYSAAAKRLVPLTRGSQWDVEVQRARYWRAIARLQRDPPDGQAMLTELTESVPLSYYGLMAADYLESVPPIERSFLGKRPGPVRDPSPRRTRWLLRAGFLEAAQDEVGSWVHGSKLDRAQRLTAARLLHDVGEHLRAVRTILDGFGGALEQGIDPAWREAWQLAWPRPFDASVEDAVEEFAFDPSLIYAIMREESTYYAAARSPAGALGLMQIIPPTGDRIARKLGNAAFQPEDLLNPDLNIRFGTYYLKYLLERFKGSSALAIAAYNAGPDVVTRWWRRDRALTHDAFVESVPYGETRRYLRRVLRSHRVYRLLYEGGTAGGISARPR